jgi:hypothetical protein
MANVTLSEFIDLNRDELIGRCRAKVTGRTNPPATEAEIARGIPLFLQQLADELRQGVSKTAEIRESASQHGSDLLLQGFTVGQVVHDYGDICQAVTDLAVELAAPISTDDFRTLNRCLDDAIAAAVTEFGRGQEVTRSGKAQEVLALANSAIAAFEVLLTGSVGIGGSTGALVHRTLLAIRAVAERPRTPTITPPAPATTDTV